MIGMMVTTYCFTGVKLIKLSYNKDHKSTVLLLYFLCFPTRDQVHVPQKGWKQKQETEIETKIFHKVPQTAIPLCLFLQNVPETAMSFLFLGHIIETETVFKGGGVAV